LLLKFLFVAAQQQTGRLWARAQWLHWHKDRLAAALAWQTDLLGLFEHER
jgi:hypothetical protein